MAQDTQLLVRIDADLKARLAAAAVADDRSIAWVVRKALRDFVSTRPQAERASIALVAPACPTYRRPPGRPAKADPEWLDDYHGRTVLAWLDEQGSDRVTHDDAFAAAYSGAVQASAGHHARVDNILRAAGWVELIETQPNGDEQTFWFREDPRKR